MNNAADIFKKFSSIDMPLVKRLAGIVPGVVVLVAITALFYRFVYLAGAGELAATEAKKNEVKAEITSIQAQGEAAARLRSDVMRAEEGLMLAGEKLRLLSQRLPQSRRISMIIDDISDGKPRRGGQGALRISSIKPMPVEEKGELVRLPFQVATESHFQAFGEYLERLENLTRVMIIDNFMIEAKDDGSGILTAQLFLSAYVMAAPPVEARP